MIINDLNEGAYGCRWNTISDEDKKTFEPFVAVVTYLKEKDGLAFDKHLIADIQSASAPKGVGNSASIAAAFSLVLFKFMGKKTNVYMTNTPCN